MFKILLFTLFLSIYKCSDVLEYTDSNFQDNVYQYSLVLVKFYAPWCGHCKKLAPEFDDAAQILKTSNLHVALAKVDCTVEKEVCKKYGVTGYPTLKVFKNGEFAFDYSGERTSAGIVSYMNLKSGPVSKEIEDMKAFNEIFTSTDLKYYVVGCFTSKNTKFDVFYKVATSLSEQIKFVHSFDASVCAHAKLNDNVGVKLPKLLESKFEDPILVYTDAFDEYKLKSWVDENQNGLAGIRNSETLSRFERKPLIIAYYNVDYIKNPKGTNYWRNRFMKVSKEVRDARKVPMHFAISNFKDMPEVEEFGLDTSDLNSVFICAFDKNDKKFKMSETFSMDAYRTWLNSFLDNKLEPYLKSEEIPSSNTEAVKVVVAKTFDEIVNDPTKDVLIEFYAPWCGHCKSLEPKYNELAEIVSNEKDIVIAKMDATANDVPKQYSVSGFPTLYFAKKDQKLNPMKFDGGREVKDMIEFLTKHATDGLKSVDKDGKKIEL